MLSPQALKNTLAATAMWLTLVLPALGGGSPEFIDNLDKPARMSPLAVSAPVLALSRVEAATIVGVGLRGHILRSSDNGKTWKQMESPVSSDLVAVHFPTPQLGIIVGHDAVILRSTDGGIKWSRILDGRSLPASILKYYEKLIEANRASPELNRALENAKRFEAEGISPPFLSVFMRNAREGWAIGQFNLILHTADGGLSWAPLLEKTQNTEGYALHAIRSLRDDIYVVGELGLILKLDRTDQTFKKVAPIYEGSWFGLAANDARLVIFGLRGNAFSSQDGGGNWTRLETATKRSINGGAFLADGRLVLVNDQGALLVGGVNSAKLSLIGQASGVGAVYDLLPVEPGILLAAGARGIKRLAVAAEP